MSDTLTAGQRAAHAVEDGGTREAAERHGAPYSVVKLARVVRERSPETFAELRAGRVGVTKAHKIACERPAMSGEVLPLFDYADLHPAAFQVAREAAEIIRIHGRRLVEDAMEIGRQLDRVKETLDHGQFLGWLRVEFGWSDDTARNLMNVWRAFKNRTVRDLEPIDLGALYLLAAPSAPGPIRDAFLEKAAKGERVTRGDVKDAFRGVRERTEQAREPKAVDEELAPEPAPPDPQLGVAFELAAAVGGRLRDLEQIMDAHAAREVAWAFRTSPLSSPGRFLARARRVAAFLAEIESELEDGGEQAA